MRPKGSTFTTKSMKVSPPSIPMMMLGMEPIQRVIPPTLMTTAWKISSVWGFIFRLLAIVMVMLAMISIAPMLLTKTASITVNERRITANVVGLPEFLMICTASSWKRPDLSAPLTRRKRPRMTARISRSMKWSRSSGVIAPMKTKRKAPSMAAWVRCIASIPMRIKIMTNTRPASPWTAFISQHSQVTLLCQGAVYP